MPVSGLRNIVWWWNLDRDGEPVQQFGLSDRSKDAPPIKNFSPYTPAFYVDGKELPATHLHHKDGQIIGIHGEADLVHLRVTLLMCLRFEEVIIRELSGKHHIDIMLEDVLTLLQLC
jgi:hypothetical protein